MAASTTAGALRCRPRGLRLLRGLAFFYAAAAVAEVTAKPIVVEGPSMHPTVRDGEIVLVERASRKVSSWSRPDEAGGRRWPSMRPRATRSTPPFLLSQLSSWVVWHRTVDLVRSALLAVALPADAATPIHPVPLRLLAALGPSPETSRARLWRAGDVVMARNPRLTSSPPQYVLKRVAYRGGEAQEDRRVARADSGFPPPRDPPTLPANFSPTAEPRGPCRPGTVWLEGDNPRRSRDSRSEYGAVPEGLVEGRALCSIWPPFRRRSLTSDEVAARRRKHAAWVAADPVPMLGGLLWGPLGELEWALGWTDWMIPAPGGSGDLRVRLPLPWRTLERRDASRWYDSNGVGPATPFES